MAKASSDSTALSLGRLSLFPAVLRDAGPQACFAADEFFSARLRNPHTRRAYGRAVRRFLEWCEDHDLALRQIRPGTAARFFDTLAGSVSGPRVALAALRHFFDLLVVRHAIVLYPFAPAPVAIDCARPIGLRDRAVIATLTYTGARVGAVAQLRLQDLRDYGEHRSLCFREKRGKEREVPVRLDLDQCLAEYIDAAGIVDDPKAFPLFRTADFHTPSGLGAGGVGAWTIRRLLKRRLDDAGLPQVFSPHSFRVMVVTDLLSQGVPMEDVQYLAGHSHLSTTHVYDRRARRVTRNVVERISV